MDKKYRLLYVEDNLQDIDLTRNFFEERKEEFELKIATSGEQFIQLLGSESFDLVLLDNKLPDFDGITILKELARLSIKIPIILLTGSGNDELVAEALRIGASAYIQKTGDYLENLPDLIKKTVSEFESEAEAKKIFFIKYPLNILIIENDNRQIDLITDYYKNYKKKYIVHIAKSCLSALKILEVKKNTDLVLFNLNVADMKAAQFIEKIKNDGFDLPVIVYAEKGSEDEALSALNGGAVDYILKRENFLMEIRYAAELGYLKHKVMKIQESPQGGKEKEEDT
ncbi:multi-sensor signal transduction histidine kinase [Melioribacter roseus P3M-2]|uniref:Multi-sensor signal transduction histidine kinase n=1 Tax=Melioribacter roseus (strain DSM 23840 / JCM 17771 / VKM B-2668 / P3M-2) TaxID=1191523 RepID=I6Z7V9_MELRP|nr:response regulator [Melioribacter roseus]AFN75250.1 multi-sensor signal transduction histidine kinase [Melioribacter roseus P3M-2]